MDENTTQSSANSGTAVPGSIPSAASDVPRRGRPSAMRCDRGHIIRGPEGKALRDSDARPESCPDCARGVPPRAPRARPAVSVPGIDTISPEEKAARDAKAAEEAKARDLVLIKAKREEFLAAAAMCEGVAGVPLAKLAGAICKQQYRIDLSKIECEALVSVPTKEGVEFRTTTVEKALARATGELMAIYLPGGLTHPAIPAFATLGLAGMAIMAAQPAPKIKAAA